MEKDKVTINLDDVEISVDRDDVRYLIDDHLCLTKDEIKKIALAIDPELEEYLKEIERTTKASTSNLFDRKEKRTKVLNIAYAKINAINDAFWDFLEGDTV